MFGLAKRLDMSMFGVDSLSLLLYFYMAKGI